MSSNILGRILHRLNISETKELKEGFKLSTCLHKHRNMSNVANYTFMNKC